jgi:hypothetical protein
MSAYAQMATDMAMIYPTIAGLAQTACQAAVQRLKRGDEALPLV